MSAASRTRPGVGVGGRQGAAGWAHRLRSLPGYLVLWSWTILCLAPLVLTLLSSVKSNTEIFASQLGLPSELRLENYASAWAGTGSDGSLPGYLLNSIVVAIVALGLGVGAGTLAAYALARWRSRVSDALYLWLLILLTVPLLVTMIPIFGMASSFGLRNNVVALGMVYAAFIVPTATVLMRAFFQDFPNELVEAASLDGCSEWQAFRRIVLPMSLGAIGGVSILALIWVWGELLFAIVLMTRPEAKTLPVGLLSFRGQYFTDLGVLFAGLTIATGPILLAYLLFQRRVTKGVTLGAFR